MSNVLGQGPDAGDRLSPPQAPENLLTDRQIADALVEHFEKTAEGNAKWLFQTILIPGLEPLLGLAKLHPQAAPFAAFLDGLLSRLKERASP